MTERAQQATKDRMPNVFTAQSVQSRTSSTNGAESITKTLSEFGLDEKEAQLYVYLLKYGPKRAGDLARSLKTYRLEVYRKLAALVTKNMVSVKKESPAVYTAVPLEKALNDLVLAREGELRLMETIKAELLKRVNGTSQALCGDVPVPVAFSMDDDRAVTQLLSAFAIQEKDAQLYIYLLKYGPKRAGDLARSLKTYREDVYRRCARLINVGVATRTSEDASRYVPVDLEVALTKALTVHTRELHRLQMIQQRLVEDARVTQPQRDGPPRSFKLVKTVGELATTISQLINTAKSSIILAAPSRFNLISMGGFQDHLRYAVARGVSVRGVLDIDPRKPSVAREYLNCGIALRHKGHYRGLTLVVADGRRSITLMCADLKTALSLDENVAALWSDSAAQAAFLTSAFEIIWERATSAEEYINQKPCEGSNREAPFESLDRTLPSLGYSAAQSFSLTRS